MALYRKFLALLHTCFITVDSVIPSLPSATVDAAYTDICAYGEPQGPPSLQFWRRRFYGDGFGACGPIHDLTNQKSANTNNDKFISPIFIFGSYTVKGGSLFASVPNLIHVGFKKFIIALIIDYFDPNGIASFVCHEILKQIQEMARARARQGVTVDIYQFQISDTASGISATEIQNIRAIEAIARAHGLLTDIDNKAYTTISSLQDIINGDPYEVLVDGIVGTHSQEILMVPYQCNFIKKLRTTMYAIYCFAQKAKRGYHKGAIIVVNILPSRVYQHVDGWLSPDHYLFPFHAVISPGWHVPAVFGPEFTGVTIYWTFFKLMDPAPAKLTLGFKQYHSTLFQLLSAWHTLNQLQLDHNTLQVLNYVLEWEKTYNCLRMLGEDVTPLR